MLVLGRMGAGRENTNNVERRNTPKTASNMGPRRFACSIRVRYNNNLKRTLFPRVRILMAALEFIKVTKRFSGKAIVSNLSFSVQRGEALGILGPVGAGKTTVLLLAVGLLSPERGSIHVLGSSMESRPVSVLAKMNLASASVRLSGYSSVFESLLTYARLYGVARPVEKVHTLARVLGVDSLLASGIKIFRLSAGENAKVNLCKALLNDPDVLLLDEITSHLDPRTKDQVLTLLKTIQKKRAMTIVFASQQVDDVQALCRRVLILNAGKRVYLGAYPKKNIFRYYA